MKRIWEAIVARAVWLITPKPAPVQVSDPPLKPGECECGHRRCIHKNGKDTCGGMFPPDPETKDWTSCSCQIFILDEDDDDDDDPEDAPTPSPEELERMMR